MTDPALARELEQRAAELEADRAYLTARINKLRHEYGNVFASFGAGRQARLNCLEDELTRLDHLLEASEASRAR